VLTMLHTEVPKELEGCGIGSERTRNPDMACVRRSRFRAPACGRPRNDSTCKTRSKQPLPGTPNPIFTLR
jgi:hypothetical protein